jgi:nucleotide-binding universal stress UspA family protein
LCDDRRACRFSTGWRIQEALMFKTIVLGLDGSEHSDRVIPIAQELAQAASGKIIVVHVREIVAARGGAHPVRLNENELQAKIESQVAGLGAAGIETSLQTFSVASGGPAHEIADVAAAEHADLIVVGTRGHSGVAGVLFGSVSQRLLHLAHCPVLAVPPPAA